MTLAKNLRDRRLLSEAKYHSCQWCGRDDSTIVAAHFNGAAGGKGMGIKASDAFVAYVCSRCHTDIDQSPWMNREQRNLIWRIAHDRTRLLIEEAGLATDEVKADWIRFDSLTRAA